MELKTAQFGVINIGEDELINFPMGIPGFENNKKFVLIGNDPAALFFWLQSAEDPNLCFVVTDPFSIYPNYYVDVDDDDVNFLEITDSGNVMTLAVVVIPEKIEETRVNLKAPILINVEKKIGKQIIQKDESLPIRYYLYQN
ncbi:MAG: flagellar assembly protein FliW [Clostridiaceae bacterium]|nr:flagellar assembly protein FliW [Clostridiaceae bacterium]